MRTFNLKHRSLPRGFTLIEILIVVVILGILSSIVIPQFTSASQEARASTLKETLQYLRTQITVYKAQHRDVPPGYPNGNMSQTPDGATFWSQLTQYSNDQSALSATPGPAFPFGKYLSTVPANAFTSQSAVLVVTSGTTTPAPDQTQPFGWIYNPQTLDIIPNVEGVDSQGIPYSNY